MKYRTYLLYFLVLMYVSGGIGFVLNPGFFLPFTPFTLLFTCFVFLLYQPILNLKFALSFAAIAIIGFCSEVIGVKTGWVFGEYSYGAALGMKFLNVPLTISLNWALLATASILVSRYFSQNKIIAAIIAASIATLIDLLIEQVAPLLDFWYFSSGKASLHNYVGWFVISFSVAFLFSNNFKQGNKKISIIILALQILFFALIYILN